jgi:PAS domain S-box-containing protein
MAHLRATGQGPIIGRRIEISAMRSDGTEFSVELTVVSVAGADRPTFLGTICDITERKQAEAALRKQQALLLSISEGTTDVVFVKDLQGRYQLINTAASRFVGKPVEEVLGKDDMAILPPEAARTLMAGDRAIMASGRTQTFEEHVQLSSGQMVTFLATKGPIFNALGDVVGLFGIARDITERRNLEQQLRESQKMEAIGRLAGGIAHDFNNILAGILGHVDLAEMDRPSPELAENLRVIKKGGQRASELVRQILTFSRRQEAKRVPLRLDLVVEEVIQLLRVAVPRSIKFAISLDRTPTVLADATQIHQVIMNLGNNAAYAMADRPGTLTISVTECEVDADLARHRPDLHPGRYVRLSVADTGCGMDPTTLQRVFEPFYTTKPVGEGTGLGLAVVHGIMKSHDGGILLDSQLGRGTTFHLYFPVFGAEAMPPAAGMSDLLRGRGEHILIVDDEEILVKLGQRILERLGYRVTIQTSPQAAVAAVQADPAAFDLVLTDLAMPEMRGDELAKAVLAIRPGLPIILATGFNTLVHEEKSPWLGFSGYLSKPYETRTLAEMLRQILNKSNAPDS